MVTVKFRGWDCAVLKGKYDNGQTALTLVDVNTGESVATATVALPEGEHLAPDSTYIKDWSENEGILKALIDADIVEDAAYSVTTGFVEANLVHINDLDEIGVVE